jgi:hypothetical protein
MNENPIASVSEEEESRTDQTFVNFAEREANKLQRLVDSSPTTTDEKPDADNQSAAGTPDQTTTQPQQNTKSEQELPKTEEEEDREQYAWEEGYDAGDAVRDAAEAVLAPAVGMLDTAIGIPNELLLKHMGLRIPEIPKYQNEHLQSIRDLSSIIGPTVLTFGKAAPALTARAAKISQGSKLSFLSGRVAESAGRLALGAGSGAVIDYSAPSSDEGHNLTGFLKENWPAPFGWIPDDIATLSNDAPDVIRNKQTYDGLIFGTSVDVLSSFGKVIRGLRGIEKATEWVPENELAKATTDKLNKSANQTVEEIYTNNAKARKKDLENLAAYEFEKNVELGLGDQPIRGIHDVFDPYEMGIRPADDGGVVLASVNQVQIVNNDGTIYGRLGSIFTPSAIKFAIDNPEGAIKVLKEAGANLDAAGKYGFRTANRYYTHAEIMEEGDRIAGNLLDMDFASMKRAVEEMSQVVIGTGGKRLTEEGYAGVFKAINKYLKEYANISELRAYAYASASLSGQVSDMAQTVRLMDGTLAVERAQEDILDRIEFLMTAKAQHSYIAGRTLNMANMWKRLKRVFSKPSDLVKETKDTMARLAQESKDAADTLRAVKAERPDLLDPLNLAYEVTDGQVNSITKLNNYIRQSTGLFKKALFDKQPELPSAVVQGIWANIYNSTLSSLVTPLKAGLSNAALLIERPIATFVGAAINRDTKTMRRGLYQYQAFGETFTRAWSHMNQVFSRVSKDPTKVGYVMRDDIARQNEKTLEALNAFAKSASEQGNDGPAALLGQIELMHDLEQNPMLRFGPNAMTAFDGFTRSVIANIEARGKAFDLVNASNGKLTADKMQAIGDEAYKRMFDSNGMITESAVEHASREIAMNLDGPASRTLNELLKAAPAFKPFLMFPRTSMNMMTFAGSHNPLGVFFDKLNAFSLPFEKVPRDKAKALLKARGIDFDDANVEQVYSNIRAELKGRKAIGALAVTVTGIAFMGDRIRGDGIYKDDAQRLRRDADWKPRTYKGTDGRWYSYENLGPVADWIALTANIMDNVVDGTLDPNDGELLMNKAGFILSSSIVNKSFLAGLEPMNDVFAGNPAAAARWGSTFTSGFIPLSGLRNDLSRLITPQKKELEMEMSQLIANRNPLLKGMLPDTHDYIDGGLVGVPGAWTRVWNTFSPWKVHDDISPEKQFLVDVEFDGRPVLSTDGSGVKLTPEQRSDIQRIMGERGYYKREIQKIMNSTDGRAFRKAFRQAQAANKDVDLKDYRQLHVKLNRALRTAIRFAINKSDHSADIRALQFKQNQTRRAAQRDNLEQLRRYNNY